MQEIVLFSLDRVALGTAVRDEQEPREFFIVRDQFVE